MDDVPGDDMLAIVRRAYSKQLLASAGITDDPALERAFAAVPRHLFLGPPPWHIKPLFARNPAFAVADPVVVNQDVLCTLAPERGVNNGQPSLHAAWLHAARLGPGCRVAHIGAGTGYYPAVMAELVGAAGHVTAIEFDAGLAALAADNLAGYPQVEVITGDGFAWPREPVDCVYVGFGAERPAAAWIDQLAPGGRLLFPLGVPLFASEPRRRDAFTPWRRPPRRARRARFRRAIARSRLLRLGRGTASKRPRGLRGRVRARRH
jgi:protein-L-isoaspartate(D-aspartate) O-methyltransferase